MDCTVEVASWAVECSTRCVETMKSVVTGVVVVCSLSYVGISEVRKDLGTVKTQWGSLEYNH